MGVCEGLHTKCIKIPTSHSRVCVEEDIAELDKFDEELMKSSLNQGKMVIE
ncbi:unnamed protein product [Rhodiola kirilowii]